MLQILCANEVSEAMLHCILCTSKSQQPISYDPPLDWISTIFPRKPKVGWKGPCCKICRRHVECLQNLVRCNRHEIDTIVESSYMTCELHHDGSKLHTCMWNVSGIIGTWTIENGFDGVIVECNSTLKKIVLCGCHLFESSQSSLIDFSL